MSRKLQQYLHYPSTGTLKNYLNNNIINNCQIKADDINRAEIIYGSAVPYIQGHMTRERPLVHTKIEKAPLPPIITLHHRTVALFIDFFFVNGNIFVHSKSEKVNFLTAKYYTSRSLNQQV